MGGAEGVVHVHIGHFGQFLGEHGIVGFLFVVVTNIFQQDDVAIFHGRHGLLHLGADAIIDKGDGLAEQFGEFFGNRLQRHGGFAFPLRPAHVRGQDKLATFLDEQLQRGQGLHDPGGIGDDHLAVFFLERHVVIHAHEHAFAFDIKIANSKFCHKLKLFVFALQTRRINLSEVARQ